MAGLPGDIGSTTGEAEQHQAAGADGRRCLRSRLDPKKIKGGEAEKAHPPLIIAGLRSVSGSGILLAPCRRWAGRWGGSNPGYRCIRRRNASNMPAPNPRKPEDGSGIGS